VHRLSRRLALATALGVYGFFGGVIVVKLLCPG
jgi:hypothetical protein